MLSLLKSAEIVFNLSTSILFTSVFKLTKSNFATNLEVSILAAFFKSAFVAKLYKSSLIIMSPPGGSYALRKHWLIYAKCLLLI